MLSVYLCPVVMLVACMDVLQHNNYYLFKPKHEIKENAFNFYIDLLLHMIFEN